MNKNTASDLTPSFLVKKSWAENDAQYQELSWREFIITTRLANNAPRDAEHLPAKVEQGGTIMWRFNKNGPAKVAFLRQYGEDAVLVLAGNGAIYEAIFISDLPKLIPVKVKGVEVIIPVRSALEHALCKRDTAKDMGHAPIYSIDERREVAEVEEAARKRKAEEEATRRAAHEAARREKQAADLQAKEDKDRSRAEKFSRIMSRKEVTCFTKDGGHYRHGVPVVGDEWMCLKNDKFCISVSSYDDETGMHGEVVECFRVSKNGPRVKRECVQQVQQHLEQTTIAHPSSPMEIEAEEVGKFTIGTELVTMPIYVGVKPSQITYHRPFAVRAGGQTTFYSRESGELRALGIERREAQAS